jgi:hypothetical protein
MTQYIIEYDPHWEYWVIIMKKGGGRKTWVHKDTLALAFEWIQEQVDNER